jgi:hypothetical protein
MTSCTSISEFPTHLQHIIFASAAAPLTTCKASAGIPQDTSLTAQWLLAQNQQPLQRAAAHQLWDVCELLLATYKYRPGLHELKFSLLNIAAAGRMPLVHTCLQESASQYPQAYRTQFLGALARAASNQQLPLCSALVHYPCVDAKLLGWALRSSDAAAEGGTEGVHLLLTSRPDITTPAMWSQAVLSAAGAGQVQTMQDLLQQGASQGHETQAWLQGCLARAASRNQMDSVAWLLAQSMTDEEVGQVLEDRVADKSVAVVRLLINTAARLRSDTRGVGSV